ncbi:hypothetical protein BC834DRAFT_1041505 [Gloeopeniophorella convolvens]|nr:hypothetical protein BC834DRAFT_1041505 [Gloeopeniophorella convolvens]
MPHFRIFDSRHSRMLHRQNEPAYKRSMRTRMPPTHSQSTQVTYGQGAARIAKYAARWAHSDTVRIGIVAMQSAALVPLCQSTLSMTGFVCEALVQPGRAFCGAGEIPTAIVHGTWEESSINNFEREGERNYIVQVVCEATQSTSMQVQAKAFECLMQITTPFHSKMAYYMERALFGLAIMGMKSEAEPVGLQKIEFWMSAAKEETNMKSDHYDAQKGLPNGDVEAPKYFIKIALPKIVPVRCINLVSLLTLHMLSFHPLSAQAFTLASALSIAAPLPTPTLHTSVAPSHPALSLLSSRPFRFPEPNCERTSRHSSQRRLSS